jgi:PAS domain S-box-containing protein
VNRRRIYLVEDEPIIAAGIERKVVQLGYEVAGSASSGEKALKAMESTRPDLVLMDIKLEGRMDGIETAAEIRRRFEVPVVFLTAYADEATLDRATKQDPFAYIVKPFTDRELFGAIEVALHRHQLHRELREREQRYRMLSEVLSDFAFCVRMARDPDQDELEWVIGRLEDVVGIATEEVSAIDDILYLVSPEDIGRVREYWAGLREGAGGGLEFRIIRNGAKTNWVRIDASMKEGEDGSPRLYGALKNITELRETEQRLEEREFEFSRIVQTMRQGIWVGDGDGVCIYANQALCDMTGYTREEIVGRNSLSMLVGSPEDIPPGHSDEDGADRQPYELQFRRKDGEALTVLVTPRRIEGEDGSLRGSFNLIVDVTRQRHALDVLSRSKRKLEGVFHASPLAGLLIDAATNAVLDVNEAFVQATGFNREEIVGTGGFGLADYEDLDDLNRMVSLLKERVSGTSDIRIRTRDGASRLFSVEVREIVVDAEELLLLILSES